MTSADGPYKKDHSKYWVSSLIAVGIVANIMSYQNCSKVAVQDTQMPTEATVNQADIDDDTKILDCPSVSRYNNDKWMVPNGTTRTQQLCKLGIGMQFQVMELEKELICLNGQISETGAINRRPTGSLEGLCDLRCGDKKDGETFWQEISKSDEEKMCPTSLNIKALVKYLNEAEYKCIAGTVKATGATRQSILSETECPPLAFNDHDQIASISFEDTYVPPSGTVPNAADHDYNDYVGTIKVLEKYNSLEQLTKITIEYKPLQKVSGMDSQLVLVFDGKIRGRGNWQSNVSLIQTASMFEGSAKIEMKTYKDNQLVSTKSVNKNEDLIIFNSTKEALASNSKVVISVTEIQGSQNLLKERKGLSIKRYRTLLHVIASNGGYDIDLSDINPAMFDNKGMPLAFFVPINWRAPKEGRLITDPYPTFKEHADYLVSGQPLDQEPERMKKWFNNLVRPDLVF